MAKQITEKEFDPKKHVKEIKCKCNQCGKVWHYLESDVSQLRVRGVANALGGCGTCCNPFSFYMLNKANEAGDQIKKLQRCPECNSSDVTKKTVYHEKK